MFSFSSVANMFSVTSIVAPSLRKSVISANITMVKELLASIDDSSIDEFDSDGLTPLMLAAVDGSADICAVLIAHGASTSIAGSDGLTALDLAQDGGHSEVVLLILNHEQSALRSINTTLLSSASKGDAAGVNAALGQGAHINFRNKKGMSALLAACRAGHANVVQTLLYRRADVTAVEPSSGRNSLIIAAFEGYSEIADMLVYAGADVNCTDNKGMTAKEYAVARSFSDLAMQLELHSQVNAQMGSKKNGAGSKIGVFQGGATGRPKEDYYKEVGKRGKTNGKATKVTKATKETSPRNGHNGEDDSDDDEDWDPTNSTPRDSTPRTPRKDDHKDDKDADGAGDGDDGDDMADAESDEGGEEVQHAEGSRSKQQFDQWAEDGDSADDMEDAEGEEGEEEQEEQEEQGEQEEQENKIQNDQNTKPTRGQKNRILRSQGQALAALGSRKEAGWGWGADGQVVDTERVQLEQDQAAKVAKWAAEEDREGGADDDDFDAFEDAFVSEAAAEADAVLREKEGEWQAERNALVANAERVRAEAEAEVRSADKRVIAKEAEKETAERKLREAAEELGRSRVLAQEEQECLRQAMQKAGVDAKMALEDERHRWGGEKAALYASKVRHCGWFRRFCLFLVS
jgi:ankyrin repeat protein